MASDMRFLVREIIHSIQTHGFIFGWLLSSRSPLGSKTRRKTLLGIESMEENAKIVNVCCYQTLK